MPFDCQHGGPRGRLGGFQRGAGGKNEGVGASTSNMAASTGKVCPTSIISTTETVDIQNSLCNLMIIID